NECRLVAKRMYEFLGNQKFEKDGRLGKVLPDMQRVIKSSDFITVVLITDGSADIAGTPFDDKINTVYWTWHDEIKKNQKFFVTLPRARAGATTHDAVNMPPCPPDLPPLPDELISGKTVKVAAVTPKPAPAGDLSAAVRAPKPQEPHPTPPASTVAAATTTP